MQLQPLRIYIANHNAFILQTTAYLCHKPHVFTLQNRTITKCSNSKTTYHTYGPCSTICRIGFRLITFETRRIARKAYHSRDHQGCANKSCFSSFSFSTTLKSSQFQVVNGIIIAKSATVNKTPNTSRNIVPIEKKNQITCV